mmetsp:Transcript_13351/g.25345  ORF Transcript_13351/g.25345 Transcript_13351/m.25345 type:complete len:248 (+) Transcript_13351:1916-2659(+)
MRASLWMKLIVVPGQNFIPSARRTLHGTRVLLTLPKRTTASTSTMDAETLVLSPFSAVSTATRKYPTRRGRFTPLTQSPAWEMRPHRRPQHRPQLHPYRLLHPLLRHRLLRRMITSRRFLPLTRSLMFHPKREERKRRNLPRVGNQKRSPTSSEICSCYFWSVEGPTTITRTTVLTFRSCKDTVVSDRCLRMIKAEKCTAASRWRVRLPSSPQPCHLLQSIWVADHTTMEVISFEFGLKFGRLLALR